MDLGKSKENKKKIVAKVIIFLDFDISAAECAIEIKIFSSGIYRPRPTSYPIIKDLNF